MVSEGLRIINTAMGGLLAQAETALPEEPSQVDQLLKWINGIPGIGWGLAVFVVIAITAAAIAKFTGSLDKILSFKDKYFSKSPITLSEQQLENIRQQLLQQMKANVAGRLEDSLHNLIRVDLEQEEQRHQVGRRKEPLVETKEKETSAESKT